jgi:catechol 2,3-dioxygenase-like lactoylglutathione lyase family enzyme
MDSRLEWLQGCALADLHVEDLRFFLPARNFRLALAFYRALGWEVEWQSDSLALLELGDHRFYLGSPYSRDHALHCRVHIRVQDARSWYDRAAQLLAAQSFPGAQVQSPVKEEYGALVTYVTDPSGVVLEFAQVLQG